MKNYILDLSFLGGTPVFSDLLHVGKPNIGKHEQFIERINTMFARHWLTNNGPFVQEFEQRVADFLGVKHCVAMCNATVGLEISARALGLKGEVIIPSFTFVAAAHALQWQEITPVFCDIDPVTHNINPEKIAQLITPRTTGILGVHVWGRACNIDWLTNIAKEHRIKLMFDAAHAFGCSYQGQMIGNFGDLEVFSFHATKFFNSFEGGMVATNNDDLYKTICSMRNFGFAGLDNVTSVGTNGKMSEVSAAMGLTSLESMQDFVQSNHQNYLAYNRELKNIPGIRIVKYNEKDRNNYQYIVIEVDQTETGVSRDTLLELLHAENIRARRYFYPGCHQMEPYCSYFPNAGLLLPETENLTIKVLQLPNGTAINQAHIAKICNLIRFIITHGKEISKTVENISERGFLPP